MIELGFIRIGFSIGLGDTFGNDFRIALLMAGVFAVRALHASSILEEFATECTTHDVVELLLHELVAILLDNVFLALANSTFAVQTDIERPTILCLLNCKTVSELLLKFERRNLPKLIVN